MGVSERASQDIVVPSACFSLALYFYSEASSRLSRSLEDGSRSCLFSQTLGRAATGIDNLPGALIVSSSSAMWTSRPPSQLERAHACPRPHYLCAKGSYPDRILLALTDESGWAVQGRSKGGGGALCELEIM